MTIPPEVFVWILGAIGVLLSFVVHLGIQILKVMGDLKTKLLLLEYRTLNLEKEKKIP